MKWRKTRGTHNPFRGVCVCVCVCSRRKHVGAFSPSDINTYFIISLLHLGRRRRLCVGGEWVARQRVVHDCAHHRETRETRALSRSISVDDDDNAPSRERMRKTPREQRAWCVVRRAGEHHEQKAVSLFCPPTQTSVVRVRIYVCLLYLNKCLIVFYRRETLRNHPAGLSSHLAQAHSHTQRTLQHMVKGVQYTTHGRLAH